MQITNYCKIWIYISSCLHAFTILLLIDGDGDGDDDGEGGEHWNVRWVDQSHSMGSTRKKKNGDEMSVCNLFAIENRDRNGTVSDKNVNHIATKQQQQQRKK